MECGLRRACSRASAPSHYRSKSDIPRIFSEIGSRLSNWRDGARVFPYELGSPGVNLEAVSRRG